MMIRRAARITLAFMALAPLGGCVSGFLGGGTPDTLYRFGGSAPASESVSSVQQATKRLVVLQKTSFPPEINGDRLLAVHGDRALYIKGSRWVTAAPSLFTQALIATLRSRAPDIRVATVPGGDVAGYALATTIDRFDVRYGDDAMQAPPTVEIDGGATLIGLTDRKVVAEKHFSIHVVAAQDRAPSIVAAYGQATQLYTASVSDWVASTTSGRQP